MLTTELMEKPSEWEIERKWGPTKCFHKKINTARSFLLFAQILLLLAISPYFETLSLYIFLSREGIEKKNWALSDCIQALCIEIILHSSYNFIRIHHFAGA